MNPFITIALNQAHHADLRRAAAAERLRDRARAARRAARVARRTAAAPGTVAAAPRNAGTPRNAGVLGLRPGAIR